MLVSRQKFQFYFFLVSKTFQPLDLILDIFPDPQLHRNDLVAHLVHSRERQDPVDHLRQTAALIQDHSCCLGCIFKDTSLDPLGIAADGHERGAEFMGRILEKDALRLVRLQKIVLHLVDLILQFIKLFYVCPGLHLFKLLFADPARCLTETAHRI